MGLLFEHNYPDDLKKLSLDELTILAGEIREELIKVVSKNGGHLASNLGVVELTMVLLKTFDPCKDKFIWDVGHQSYVYKILTGRLKNFHTLRQYEGLSGFPKISESPYDTFGAGHCGTSISAALGMAIARDHKGEDYKVMAIIGDGAMTSGQAFEGLNHAGGGKKDMLVILNDNEMSISKNVGAISGYLNRILTGKVYTSVKRETEALIKQIPRIGNSVLAAAKKAEETVKGLIVPGMLFEELGFRYIGPIDGHDIDNLLSTFENLRELSGPILIHVLTKKGKGYLPAEENAAHFHGTPPFDILTGEPVLDNEKISFTKTFSDSMVDIGKKYPEAFAITAAMRDGTGLTDFADLFPERFVDVGIAEQHAVTLAAGMAKEGIMPFVVVYSTFLQRGYDQVLHDVCLQNFPVIFCLDRGGLVGNDGPTHHGVFDFAYLSHIPNIIILSPRDNTQLRGMLFSAIDYNAPVAIRYSRGDGFGAAGEEVLSIPLGKSELLVNGDDGVIVAIGNMVHSSLSAASILKNDFGISLAVLDARFIKPFDKDMIKSLMQKYDYFVSVEEHSVYGGLGSILLSAVNELKTDLEQKIWVEVIALPDKFVEHGSQTILRDMNGLSPDAIAQRIRDTIFNSAGKLKKVTY